MNDLTHFDKDGRPRMVDVGAKEETARRAVATGRVEMQAATLERLKTGSAKGDVIAVATLAGVMGAKKAAELIPLCHPLPLTRVDVKIVPDPNIPGVAVTATAETRGRTGVEMEALAAVAAAALTVYDMLKAVDRAMTIGAIRLEEKSGGRSGEWRRAP